MADSIFIQFEATSEIKEMLSRISEQDGKASKSAVLRRLVQDEAKRRGIETPQPQPITSRSSS